MSVVSSVYIKSSNEFFVFNEAEVTLVKIKVHDQLLTIIKQNLCWSTSCINHILMQEVDYLWRAHVWSYEKLTIFFDCSINLMNDDLCNILQSLVGRNALRISWEFHRWAPCYHLWLPPYPILWKTFQEFSPPLQRTWESCRLIQWTVLCSDFYMKKTLRIDRNVLELANDVSNLWLHCHI